MSNVPLTTHDREGREKEERDNCKIASTFDFFFCLGHYSLVFVRRNRTTKNSQKFFFYAMTLPSFRREQNHYQSDSLFA